MTSIKRHIHGKDEVIICSGKCMFSENELRTLKQLLEDKEIYHGIKFPIIKQKINHLLEVYKK